MTTALKTEIKSLVRESVREVLSAELAQVRTAFLSAVSPLEMKDIAKRYKKPSKTAARSIRVRI
ncbi:hypothetical protein IT401_02405 [Candidatus Nomurabacteria bacterium]|nr:hypothetical protein [Candidatus Nomurabacteria bacterium]